MNIFFDFYSSVINLKSNENVYKSAKSIILLFIFFLFIQMFSSLNQSFDIFSFSSLQPHHTLVKQIFISLFIVSLVNLAKIFGPFMTVVKLKNFFSWDNTIKMTKDKENWYARIELLKNVQVINCKDVIVSFFNCPLLYQVNQWLKQEFWNRDTLGCYPVHYSRQGSKRGIQYQSIDFIGVHLRKHDCTKCSHTPAPQSYPLYLSVFPDLLQNISNIKYLVYSISQCFGIATTTAKKIECNDIYFKFRNQRYHRQCLNFAASITMKINNSMISNYFWTMKKKGRNVFIISIADLKIFSDYSHTSNCSLNWSEQMFF